MYNVDQEGLIVLDVKKAELIKQIPPTQQTTTNPSQTADKEPAASTTLRPQPDCPPESDIATASAPPRNVIDRAGTDIEKVIQHNPCPFL